MSKLRLLDLFSGIGGASLGLHRTGGFRTVAFCEIEPFPRKVLKKNFPGIPIFKDVRELHAEDLPEPVDVIWGSYPCQPFSVAGKQRGEDDDRHLWPEVIRLVRECKPELVLCENVAGHIQLGLDTVLSDLESEGYTTETFIIPACAVNAIHRRDRVWIMAYSKRKRSQRRMQDKGISGSKRETHAKPSHRVVDSWGEMARLVGGLRSDDGLSVGMVRSECKAYGNTVIPQIVEMLGYAVLAQLTPTTPH